MTSSRKNFIPYKTSETIFIFFFAFGFSWFLSQLPLDTAFNDRLNYLYYAENSTILFLDYLSEGVVTLLFNEPLWLLLNIVIGSAFTSEETVRLIIFSSSFIFTLSLFLKYPSQFFYLLILLLLPQVLTYFITGIRQGLAIALFFSAWLTNKKTPLHLALVICPFIHASFFFVAFLYMLSFFFTETKLPVSLRVLFTSITGFVLSIFIGSIVDATSARQADRYAFESSSGSGIGFVFWGIFLCLFVLQGKSFLKYRFFEISSIIFYLSTYFFLEVTARIFESMLPLVLISVLYLTNWRKILGLSWIFLYFIFQYSLRVGQDSFGFSI